MSRQIGQQIFKGGLAIAIGVAGYFSQHSARIQYPDGSYRVIGNSSSDPRRECIDGEWKFLVGRLSKGESMLFTSADGTEVSLVYGSDGFVKTTAQHDNSLFPDGFYPEDVFGPHSTATSVAVKGTRTAGSAELHVVWNDVTEEYEFDVVTEAYGDFTACNSGN